MVKVRGKPEKRVPSVLVTAALLAAYFMSLAAAQPSAPECEKPPSSHVLVNVKDLGARGDGRTNDTIAIQKAIDEVAGTGGTVLVPDGIYMVDAVDKETQLNLRRSMTLKLSTGATLKAIPNNSVSSSILTIAGVSKVTVIGGTLEGDREQHAGKSGEWGMGIRIGPRAEHITVSGVTAKEMWGDGFYVEGARNVTFCSVTADHNRRQGLSVIEVDGLLVTNSVFENTRGTPPSAGIDLEPDAAAQPVANVRILHSKFLNNAGAGILISGQKHTSNVSNVAITNNLFTGTLPIKIENASAVHDAAICKNRQITRQSESYGGLSSFSEPVEVVIHQSECGDFRLQKRK